MDFLQLEFTLFSEVWTARAVIHHTSFGGNTGHFKCFHKGENDWLELNDSIASSVPGLEDNRRVQTVLLEREKNFISQEL